MATHSSYSCLENTMDRGAWRATVHVAAESDTTEPLKCSRKGSQGRRASPCGSCHSCSSLGQSMEQRKKALHLTALLPTPPLPSSSSHACQSQRLYLSVLEMK